VKRFIQLVSLIMAIALLFSVPVFAAEEVNPRGNAFVMSTCIYVEEVINNQVDVWFEIIATGIMDEVGAWEIIVERSRDGVTWTEKKTFTPDDYPEMVDYNTNSHFGHVTYYGTPNYYYRAYIILYAENSRGRGEVAGYTDPILI